ncbi:hypothetical protein MalM25_08630 [Planctomycetes bacterium MalM25]|nr:hypothetical protein MalM25_08630 [Planctomycetes bacterium MalM25]
MTNRFGVMEIQPYKSFEPLCLGESTRDDCVTAFGKPLQNRTNSEGIEEFHYPHFILRFDREKRVLQECTLIPRASATIDDIEITWDYAFLRQACSRDGLPRDMHGFIVLADLGIAVTGIHDNDDSQLAITVFSEGAFDDLLKESVPFDRSMLD